MAPREPSADAPLTDAEIEYFFQPFEGRLLALAVSGGVDSMTLLHLVARWRASAAGERWTKRLYRFTQWTDASAQHVGLPHRRPSLSADAGWLGAICSREGMQSSMLRNQIVVLTVDHGLRLESADEAAFVAREAARLRLPHQTLRWTEGHPCESGTATGLQEKARAARYGLMADAIEAEIWALREQGSLAGDPLDASIHKRTIVTAHHRNDLIETFLMRLKRGAGIDGLASMRTIDSLHRWPTAVRPYPTTVDICRPLLDIPKSRLAATARAMGVTWREDPSNQDGRFERVRTRESVSDLAALGFGDSELRLSIRRLQRAREVVRQHQRRQMFHWRDSGGYVMDEHNGLYCDFTMAPALSLDEFSDLVDAASEIKLRLLRYAIGAFGGEEEPPELSQLDGLRQHLDDCHRQYGRMVRDGIPRDDAHRQILAGSARTLAGSRIDFCAATRSGRVDRVRVWREQGRNPLPELTLEPGDGGWWDNRFAISVAPDAPAPVTIRALGVQGWAKLRRRMPALALWRDVPPGAFATLPAVWRGGELVTVPYFESLPKSLPSWLKRDIDHEWEAFNGLSAKLYLAEFKPVARRLI